ncbi:hypothetical protein TorRG33x02_314710 [Trema orientale]|uniref:Uncharacterized protein n=1 Tax=Trema orientale TaxID=63057 RepID=A0A2P5BNG6_TREOI|nr:hypothetical protein TorRG33x02_314710 [Trema orientale]
MAQLPVRNSPRRWDSVIRAKHEFNALRLPPLPLVGHYFSGDSSSITFGSNCKVNSSLRRSSHGLNEIVARIRTSSSSNPEKIVLPSVKLGLDLLPNVINGSRNFCICY